MLYERAISNSVEPGGLIGEMFLGSGTSLIAAEKTGRRCFGTELAPGYVDVIVKRWQLFTGQAATLEATGTTFEATARARQKAA